MRFAVVFAAVCACYRAPASDPACAILCDQDCPSGLTCVNGFCVAPGQTCAPAFRVVRAGNGFACALDSNDLPWCWGANLHHQVDPGDATYIDRVTRTGELRFDDLALGGGHICGVRSGRLWCWGANDRGQVSG